MSDSDRPSALDPTVRADATTGRDGVTSPGELAAGASFGSRYRIVARVGEGGMGEVYRAQDLELDQTVALKLLPPRLHNDASSLDRLRQEVRLARRVSHANVCRVHDLGEVDGRYFISMEFVDGEDLASLLRRIGRLPGEKAVQLANALCSGLHAAHEQGILHRDLKPANVMLDAAGRLKITDFGLAAIGSELAEREYSSGTPAYMAPEQRAGQEVTRRSDIYALGLLLYELFTGQRALAIGGDGSVTRPAPPSTLLEGLDLTTERAIMRCLADDPEDRPGSALDVAAALPGGDPVAAALAAGELPSPEAVAASGETGTLSRRAAAAMLALVVLPLLVLAVVHPRASELGRMPPTHAPSVLAHTAESFARDTVEGLDGADSAYRLERSDGRANYFADRAEDRADPYLEASRHPLGFFFRTCSVLIPDEHEVTRNDPTFGSCKDDVVVRLDGAGRLMQFVREPPRTDPPPQGDPAQPHDWAPFFDAAQIDRSDLESEPSLLTPPVYATQRRAWSGSFDGETPLRVEAASWHGQPVFFVVLGPWDDAWDQIPGQDGAREEFEFTISAEGRRREATVLDLVVVMSAAATVLVVLVGGLLLAYRSLRRGDGDRRTAARVAIFVGLMHVGWSSLTGALPDPGLMHWLLARIPEAIAAGGITWLVYISVEPYVRRFWPRTVISWTRLWRGRYRDPLIGRDVLMGIATACSAMAAGVLVLFVSGAGQFSNTLTAVHGPRFAAGELLGSITDGLDFAFVLVLALLVLRLVLRRQWLSVLVFTVLIGGFAYEIWHAQIVYFVLGSAFGLIAAVLVARGGLLAASSALVTLGIIDAFPLTVASSSWYAGTGLLGGAVILGLAGLAVRSALGGRGLLGEDFFGGR